MWISYAGKDSTHLVEAVEHQLASTCPQIEITRYKKRIHIVDQLNSAEASDTQKQDDEWPAARGDAIDTPLATEQFYLLPMEKIVNLVLRISESPRVLVILSPAYFHSVPCLQELVALMCNERQTTPMFVLNGITHKQIEAGRIDSGEDSAGETIIELAQALVRARDKLNLPTSVGDFDTLTENTAKKYLTSITEGNVIAVSEITTYVAGHDTVATLARNDHAGSTRSTITQSAASIAEAVERYYLSAEMSSDYPEHLRQIDRERYTRWFAKGFGGKLLTALETSLNNGRTIENPADTIINRLLDKPADMHQQIDEALSLLYGQKEDNNNDRWNEGVSELAGLYALTLIDYNMFIKHGKFNRASQLLFLQFTSGDIHTRFRASVVNATLSNSLLRIRPASAQNPSDAPETPGFSMREPPSSASQEGKQVARDFVETLHAWVRHRSADTCPRGDANHPTGLNKQERADLRGRIAVHKDTYGEGSLVVLVENSQFSSGYHWVDAWDYVHEQVNDGAEKGSDSEIKLRGVIISEHDSGATITMHKQYERRLIYIRNLLTDHYRP